MNSNQLQRYLMALYKEPATIYEDWTLFVVGEQQEYGSIGTHRLNIIRAAMERRLEELQSP